MVAIFAGSMCDASAGAVRCAAAGILSSPFFASAYSTWLLTSEAVFLDVKPLLLLVSLAAYREAV